MSDTSIRPQSEVPRSWFYLILLLPLALYFLTDQLLSVDQYQQKINKYTDLTTGKEVDLPFRKIDARQITKVAGQIKLSEDLERPISHLYFPHFEGTLKVAVNGKNSFDNSDSLSLASPNRISDLLIELPKSTDQIPLENIEVHFQISAADTLFVGVSEGYAGTLEDFSSVIVNKVFLYEILRPALAAILIIACLFLLILGLSGLYKIELIGLITVFLVIVIVILSSQIAATLGSKYLVTKTIIFLPVAVGLFAFFIERSLIIQNNNRMLVLSLFYALISTCLYATKNQHNLKEIQLLLYYAIPLTILSALILGLYYSFLSFRTRSLVSFSLSSSLLFFSLAVSHDFLLKLGMIHADFMSVSLVIMTLCLSLTMALGLRTAQNIKQLRTNELHLTTALERQSLQLEEQFAERQVLLDKELNAQHRASLLTDLHDGVLNYLSSIFAVSETGTQKEASHINKLAKNAMNEIRVILDTDVDQGTGSLLVTCSVLREQIAQTLDYLGCTAHWDIATLENYPSPNNQTNLEIFRILQEALHNASTRAKATHLTIQAVKNLAGSYVLTVENSGGSSLQAAASHGHGHGIKNMQARALRINAQFMLTSQPTGARLTLTLP